jgi:hypothetical protein
MATQSPALASRATVAGAHERLHDVTVQGAEGARRQTLARAPSRAPGRGGRATTSLLERLTPRPAAEQPGRLRPRAAWAGWASAASPRRLPRPRPDTTAASAGGPARARQASVGRTPTRQRGSASPPGLWGAPAPGGSVVPHDAREPAPVEPAGTGRVRRASPQRRRGSPLGERRQACFRESRGGQSKSA